MVRDSFEPGMALPEPNVNAICAERLDDWVTPRRARVDDGKLRRNDSGTLYERT